MSRYESVRGACDVLARPMAGPGHITTRLCSTCNTIRASGGGWRFRDKRWWDCPLCVAKDSPAPKTQPTPAAQAAAAVAVEKNPSKPPFRIRCIEDLKAWCVVDDVTGCWHYTRTRLRTDASGRGKHKTKRGRRPDRKPVVRYVDPRTKENTVHHGRRAALNLARKKPVPVAHQTWAKVCCTSEDCVNPLHAMSGTHAQRGAYMRKHGLTEIFRAQVGPLLECAKARIRITPEQAVELRRRMASGETAAAVAREMGVSSALMRRIRAGERKCDKTGVVAAHLKLVTNSSIFTLAQSLQEAA